MQNKGLKKPVGPSGELPRIADDLLDNTPYLYLGISLSLSLK